MLSTEQLIKVGSRNIIYPNSIVGSTPPHGVVFTRGKGASVFDSNGKEYLELFAMLGANIIGHGREDMAEAIASQITQLEFSDNFMGHFHSAGIEYSQKLAEITPSKLKHFHFTSGGSESVEVAFKIAWTYWSQRGKKDKQKIVSLSESYHGATIATNSCTGNKNMRSFAPVYPGFVYAPSPYCYRCPFGMEYPSCEVKCAEALAETIDKEGKDTIAAFIIDPILASQGSTLPIPKYFKRVREICTERNILFISDEVISGFGRTGKLWAHQMWDIVPDILTLAKGISGGYVPFGVVATSDEIYDTMVGNPFKHGITFSGHPVGCAAASKLLDIFQKEKLVERAAEMGQYMQTRLQEFKSLPYVGDVRGLGLFGCLEIVIDKKTKESGYPEKSPAQKIWLEAWQKGLMVRDLGGKILFMPPYVITKKQIDWGVDILKEVINSKR
jgi:putrescine aminotransferase